MIPMIPFVKRLAVVCLLVTLVIPASAQQVIKDDSYSDPTFVAFKVQLVQAVLQKDTALLFTLVSDDVRVSDDVCGKLPSDCFRDLFRNEPVATNALWTDLYNMIGYGFNRKKMTLTIPGYAYKGEVVFQAPSYHDLVPEGDNKLLVTGQYVNVRSAPNASATVLERLSYTKLSYNHPYTSNSPTAYNMVDGKLWYEVILADGRKGYIIENFVSAGLQREISVKKVDGTWKIISFFKKKEAGC